MAAVNKLDAGHILAGPEQAIAAIYINPVSRELSLRTSPDLRARLVVDPVFRQALQDAFRAALDMISRDTLEG
jgi:hypothetical protein